MSTKDKDFVHLRKHNEKLEACDEVKHAELRSDLEEKSSELTKLVEENATLRAEIKNIIKGSTASANEEHSIALREAEKKILLQKIY